MRTMLVVGLAVGFCATSSSAGPQDDPVPAEVKNLQGPWVEPRAWAKGQQGRGGYYSWVFEEERVGFYHTTTIDGEAAARSGHGGTYKLDPTAKPKAIDVVMKGRGGKEQTLLGIYELNGDTLKLCIAWEGGQRPATFESSGTTRLYVLKKPPE